MWMRLVVAAVLSGGIAETAAQTQRRPIEARDGDLIMVDDVARVRLVRRREANVRAIYDPQLQRLRLLIDFAVSGGEPDGQVDQSRYFDNLNPPWPLNERWESRVTIHEYWLSAGEVSPPSGMGLVTPAGLIQFAPAGSRDDLRQYVDAPPLAVLTTAAQAGHL